MCFSTSRCFFANPIVAFLYDHVKRITSNRMVLVVVNKAYRYFYNTSSAYAYAVSKSMRSTIARVLYLALVVVVCIFILYYDHQRELNQDYGHVALNQYTMYIFVTGLFALSCSFMMIPAYWRFAMVVIVFGGCFVVAAFDSPVNDRMTIMLKAVICCLIPLCGLITWYQITWTNTGQLLSDAIVNVPIVNLVRDIVVFVRG